MKKEKIYVSPHVIIDEVEPTCGLMLPISANGTTDESLIHECVDLDDDGDDSWNIDWGD